MKDIYHFSIYKNYSLQHELGSDILKIRSPSLLSHLSKPFKHGENLVAYFIQTACIEEF
jgi:hypothetical protein